MSAAKKINTETKEKAPEMIVLPHGIIMMDGKLTVKEDFKKLFRGLKAIFRGLFYFFFAKTEIDEKIEQARMKSTDLRFY